MNMFVSDDKKCMELENAKNIKRVEDAYYKPEDRYVPCYKMTEPTAEEWNRRADITNKRSFELEHGRPPVSDFEVLRYVYTTSHGDKWEKYLREHYKAIGRDFQAEFELQVEI